MSKATRSGSSFDQDPGGHKGSWIRKPHQQKITYFLNEIFDDFNICNVLTFIVPPNNFKGKCINNVKLRLNHIDYMYFAINGNMF